MSYQTDLRNKVNDLIIAAMSKGQLPWVKPWSSAKNTGYPVNAVSGKLYRGVNVTMLLMLLVVGSASAGQLRADSPEPTRFHGTPVTITPPHRTLDPFSFICVRPALRREVACSSLPTSRWRGRVNASFSATTLTIARSCGCLEA